MNLKSSLGDDFQAAQILTQDLGDDDGAVGALVLLDDGGEDAGSPCWLLDFKDAPRSLCHE